MGAIQSSINGMLASAAIGIGAGKKLDSSVKKDQSEINQKGIEAKEKQAESAAYNKAAQELRTNPNLNIAQFIRNNTQAALTSDKSYQQMLIMQQALSVKKKSLLDLI